MFLIMKIQKIDDSNAKRTRSLGNVSKWGLEMNPYDRRGSIVGFFEGTHERNGFIKCGANHFCMKKHEKHDTSEEAKTCYFKKIMRDALCSDRIEDINLCNEWENKGIDIALCIMVQKRGMKMNKICKNWKTIDLNELTNIVARMGCSVMFELCRERKWMDGRCVGYNFVLEYAAFCGFLDIAERCKERGAGSFANALACAAGGGNVEIVKLCKEWGAKNFDEAMFFAADLGHMEIVELCKEWGATDFDKAMCAAAECGHIEIVKLCRVWGAKGFDEAMSCAAEYGYIEIVKLCKEWGAKKFGEAMIDAAYDGHIEVVKLCKKWGVENLDEVITIAAEH